jgi:hypothetical protein
VCEPNRSVARRRGTAGNTSPTEKTVADQRGVSGWNFDLAPGQQKDIRFGWRLRWPADREISMGTDTSRLQTFHFSPGSKF